MLRPRILVTRPQPQADEWVHALREYELTAHAMPLICIGAPANPTPVLDLWQRLDRQRLLMFVSPSAVDWFFQLRPPEATWPSCTLAAAPGPGTAQRLIQAGARCGLAARQILSPAPDAKQFDSESLWPMLAPLRWQDQAATVISGGDQGAAGGRTWLAEQLRAHGAQVDTLLTYERRPEVWNLEQQELARAALTQPNHHIWLFSSSQGIDHLTETLMPGLPKRPNVNWASVRTICTHPRIAERARKLGIINIVETRPTLEAVAEALRHP